MRVFTAFLRNQPALAGSALVASLVLIVILKSWPGIEPFLWLRQTLVPTQYNTAACFVMGAAVLVLLVPGSPGRVRRFIAELLSATIAGIALIGLLGKGLDINTAYGWGTMTQMATHTAAGYFVLGTTMFVVAWLPGSKEASQQRNWLALPIGIAALAVVLSLSLALQSHDSRQIRERVKAESRFVRNAFGNYLDNHLPALKRLASRWESGVAVSDERFAQDAGRYIQDYQDYIAIGWADESGTVTAQVTGPEVTRTATLGELSPLIPHTVMRQRPDAGIIVLPFAGSDSPSHGIVAVIPADLRGNRNGYLYGVLSLGGTLPPLSQSTPMFGFSVLCNGMAVIAAGDEPPGETRWRHEERFRSFGSDWTVTVWPTGGGLSAVRSTVFRSIILGSAFGVLLLLIAIHFAQVSVRRAHALRSVNRKLSTARGELERLAMFDDLTGIGNRNYFVRQLELSLATAIRARQPLCLLVLDLNGFKEVNDRLGHKAGDLVLKSVAERLTGGLRASDQTFRLGGDEFAVLLNPGTDVSGALVLADKLQERMAMSVDVGALPQAIGVSIGVAAYPQHAGSPERLLREADVAMYKAKKSGSPVAVASEIGATMTMSALDSDVLGRLEDVQPSGSQRAVNPG